MAENCYMDFRVKNKKLFDALTNLGLKFSGVDDGEFCNEMEIELPSGEMDVIDGCENWELPYLTDAKTISAWLVATILWEVQEVYPSKEFDDYTPFAIELAELLNDAGIAHLDVDEIDTWSRGDLINDLEKAFGSMDDDIEEAHIEHTYGFEGEVGPCIYAEVKDGQRMNVYYSNSDKIATEDCEGLQFVIDGELKHFECREELTEFIEGKGGFISDDVTGSTSYLICNDVKSGSSNMKKTKELGIAILSEATFIRRFADPKNFGLLAEDKICKESWSLTYRGGVLDFVMRNGTGSITMEVWKDGKWEKRISDQKNVAGCP